MGQESTRMVQSARHNSCPKERLNNCTRPDQSDKFGGSNDKYRRAKSVNLEGMDIKEVGSHHIIELPSLIEPKGLVFISTHYVYDYMLYL